jgi:hypothetical protein
MNPLVSHPSPPPLSLSLSLSLSIKPVIRIAPETAVRHAELQDRGAPRQRSDPLRRGGSGGGREGRERGREARVY